MTKAVNVTFMAMIFSVGLMVGNAIGRWDAIYGHETGVRQGQAIREWMIRNGIMEGRDGR